MALMTGPHRRNRLLSRIHRRYQTCDETLAVGSLKLQFTRIADPDRVLDDAAVAEQNPTAGMSIPAVPYWAELWDSALGLAAWLATADSPLTASDVNVANTTVLDLGCGMGLAGTCAAALGAQVTFADFQTLALLFARLNSLPWQGRVDARRVDWRHDVLGRKFDLILGADILYERSQWEFLDRFWQAHLSPDGLVALGEPGRQTGEGFIAWVVERGWALSERRQLVGSANKPIRVLLLRRQ
jgi:predicted nicotinamide N-methyase